MKYNNTQYVRKVADGHTFGDTVHNIGANMVAGAGLGAGAGAATGAIAGMGVMSGPLAGALAIVGGAIGAATGLITGIAGDIVHTTKERNETRDIITELSEMRANGKLDMTNSGLEKAILELSNGDKELAKEMMNNAEATKKLIESNAELIS
jgi:hypothetical protein